MELKELSDTFGIEINIRQNDTKENFPYLPPNFDINKVRPNGVSHELWNSITSRLNKKLNSFQDIVQNVYDHVSFYEELLEIYKKQYDILFDTWIVSVWFYHPNDVWKSIFYKVLSDELHSYAKWRNSLLLLSEDWFTAHNLDPENLAIPNKKMLFKHFPICYINVEDTFSTDENNSESDQIMETGELIDDDNIEIIKDYLANL